MAAASSKEDLTFIQLLQDKYLECALCFDTYKQPKSLLCLHTYCEPCLEEYVKHNPGDIACPTCRKVTPLPQVGVSGLENNFLIKSINDDASLFKDKKVKCNNCEEDRIAVMVCIECATYFCTGCYKIHQGLKSNRESHNTIKVENLSDAINLQEFQKNRFAVCETHREPMKLFCRTEDKQLCNTCAFTSAHRGHDLCSIKEELDSLTLKIDDKFNQLSQREIAACAENEKLKKSIVKSEEKSIRRIEDEKKSIMAQIDNYYVSMKAKICKPADEAIANLEKRISKNKSMISLINDQGVEKDALAMIPISESVMAARGILSNINSMARNIDKEGDTTVKDIQIQISRSLFPPLDHVFKFGAAAYSVVPVVRDSDTVEREEALREGDIVMRGPDWGRVISEDIEKQGDSEDGGLGGTGLVVPDNTFSQRPTYMRRMIMQMQSVKSVNVKWDTGIKCSYRCRGQYGFPLQRV